MEPPILFVSLFYSGFLLTSGIIGGQASILHDRHRERQETHDRGFRPTKLFVFGDSYADTGNIRKIFGAAWTEPYGTTFPGKPTGRFSDGRVLTDYLARFMGLKSPIAYQWRKFGGKNLRNGMNFAYGGSGAFNTLFDILPNMTTQIDFLERLMNIDSLYTRRDLQSSVVLVSHAGNDYGAYLSSGGTVKGLPSFIPRVINQIVADLKRIHGLGATRITVTSLEPLGCLPRTTETFERCNATLNSLVAYHNLLLQQAVSKLNNQTKSSSSTFFILDLYNTFTSALEQRGDLQGEYSKFRTPLRPCCIGINGSSCGSLDLNGTKMYTVCSDPESAFFWDGSHPTQAGWRAVFTTLKSTLEQFIKI